MSTQTVGAEHVAPTDSPSRPKKRQVEHLYWVKQMEWSVRTGRPIRSICGVVRKETGSIGDHTVIVGELMAVPEPEDCSSASAPWKAICGAASSVGTGGRSSGATSPMSGWSA